MLATFLISETNDFISFLEHNFYNSKYLLGKFTSKVFISFCNNPINYLWSRKLFDISIVLVV